MLVLISDLVYSGPFGGRKVAILLCKALLPTPTRHPNSGADLTRSSHLQEEVAPGSWLDSRGVREG